MKAEKIDSIPPGNPFHHDLYHMGTVIGTNIVVMYPNHSNTKCRYLIVVNTETGERIKVNGRTEAELAGERAGLGEPVAA